MTVAGTIFFLTFALLTPQMASAFTVAPTTTVSAVKGENTSAADNFKSIWTHSNGNTFGHVSKMPIRSLLYDGATTKIYAHFMGWFGGTDHKNVGYRSDDYAQVKRQINDMMSRGIDGLIIDWYGPNTRSDYTLQYVRQVAATLGGKFKFAVDVDKGALTKPDCSNISITSCMIKRLKYVHDTYFPSGNYIRTPDGRPQLHFFLSYNDGVNWGTVNNSIGGNPLYVFENTGGFSEQYSDGAFAWVHPTDPNYGLDYLSNFYYAARNSSRPEFGGTYKGFNDSPVNGWGNGTRKMGQQCGLTWLDTFDRINKNYDKYHQLPYLQLVTWNDYEEGTELETGINNCVSITASKTGDYVTWNISGDQDTIDHFKIYVSTDEVNLMPLETQLGWPSRGTREVSVKSLGLTMGKTYYFYVEAVGKATMLSHLSNAVKFVP